MAQSNVLTMADCRKAGYCARGVIARLQQLGFEKYRIVREGIPFDELEVFEDAQVQRAIDEAKKRIANDG